MPIGVVSENLFIILCKLVVLVFQMEAPQILWKLLKMPVIQKNSQTR